MIKLQEQHFQWGSGYRANAPSFPDFISKSHVLLSSCTGHWKQANVSSSLAQGKATLLRPKNLSRGRGGAALSPHRPPCPKSPSALMLCGSCCVPRSSLPCSPSTFRVLLCPEIGHTNPKPNFYNQHSVKLPCWKETLRRISPSVTVWSFSWLAAIAYNEGIINFCFKGIGDRDMDTAWLYHLCGWHILIHTIFPSVLDTTEHQRSQSTLCWNSPKKTSFHPVPCQKTLQTTSTENGSPLQCIM